MRSQALAVVAAVALVGCGQAVPSPSVGHEFGYSGERGPQNWGELNPDWETCVDGERQSPIDLGETQPQPYPDPVLSYVPARATVTDTGHTVMVEVPEGSTMAIDGSSYALAQFHYHTPAEHPFDGVPADAEWHFVHRTTSGALGVLALLVEEGTEAPAWQPVVDAIGAAPTEGDKGAIEQLHPASLLPSGLGSVRYEGSLTTPPCSEGVKWVVLTERLPMSAAQLTALRDRYAGNARPAQDRNERPVHQDEPDR